MRAAAPSSPPADDGSSYGPLEYARAVLNILEDSGVERARLLDTQKAVLNILDDFSAEKLRLLETQKAVMNILEDLAAEKRRLERAQQEVLRSEQALRQSLCEKEVLLKEIHHRVKNNLQVISSLLLLQARHLDDAGAREILGESQNRVRSIALVHEKLYRSTDLARIDFGEYVTTLIDNLFQTYNASGRGIGKVVDVHTLMTIDTAIPCGLIVNELVTNSLKHAFPAGRLGNVRVVARTAANTEGPGSGGRGVERGMELNIEDDGVGLPDSVEPRSGRSLGLDLVFTLARQIKAEVDVVRGEGTTFRFTFHGRG